MTRRDRLRELLDAVLDEQNGTLADMAEGAHTSPYHFSRQLSRDAGEPPGALRRRVMLERAAWQMANGTSVTEAAFDAGYESVEGFGRAYAKTYGYPPSATPVRATQPAASHHWADAPNGVHFHPPINLWVADESQPLTSPLAAHLVHHDVDDTAELITLAATLSPEDLAQPRVPGLRVLEWDGPEESIAAVLNALIRSKEVWLAAIEGRVLPSPGERSAAALAERSATVSPRWLAMVREVERTHTWHDRIIDALCEPPESFALGHIVAHVITFAAHRRQLVRHMLRAAGVEVDDGDPITWLRAPSTTPQGE